MPEYTKDVTHVFKRQNQYVGSFIKDLKVEVNKMKKRGIKHIRLNHYAGVCGVVVELKGKK